MSRINVMLPTWARRRSRQSPSDRIRLGGAGSSGRRLRAAFAQAQQADFAVATSSCTTALHLALIVAGVGRATTLSVLLHCHG